MLSASLKLFSDAAALTGANLSLLVLLTKATVILLAALGITLLMQRASAGARHLVWLVTLSALLLVPALSAWGPLQIAILPASKIVRSEATPSFGSASNSATPSSSTLNTPSGGNVGKVLAPPLRQVSPLARARASAPALTQ
jgi:hypothetical protein